MAVEGVSVTNWEISDVTISTEDATDAGASTYAMHLRGMRATSFLSLVESHLLHGWLR